MSFKRQVLKRKRDLILQKLVERTAWVNAYLEKLDTVLQRLEAKDPALFEGLATKDPGQPRPLDGKIKIEEKESERTPPEQKEPTNATQR